MGQFEPIQEIVDLIVDHLFDIIQESRCPDSDSEDLDDHRLPEFKEIALINRSFASRCQKYLFSSVDLGKRIYDSQFNVGVGQFWEPELDEIDQRIVLNLVTIFREKPHLAAHLRTFTICIHFGNLTKRYETLASLLSLLQPYGNPRNLNISTTMDCLNCHRPDPDPSIFRRLRVQHIKCEVVQSPKMPVSIIANNAELKSLELLFYQKPDDVDSFDLTRLTARPTIKRLTVGRSLGLLDYLVEPRTGSPSILDFSSLEYLRIDCEAVDRTSTVQRLLRLAENSLEECKILTNVISGAAYNTNLDFSTCTSLRRVFLSTTDTTLNHDSDDAGPQGIIDKFVTILGTVPSPNLVETVGITFYHDVENGYDSLDVPSWEFLDREIHRLLTAGHSSKNQVAWSLHFMFVMMYTDEYADIERQKCLQFIECLKPRFQITATSKQRINFEIKQDLAIFGGNLIKSAIIPVMVDT